MYIYVKFEIMDICGNCKNAVRFSWYAKQYPNVTYCMIKRHPFNQSNTCKEHETKAETK